MSAVVRVWKGYGTAEGVARYCRDHFEASVLPRLRASDGFLGASVLTRPAGETTEVVVATSWRSIDAVKAFAGDDYVRAVVEPVVRALLDRVDDRVSHFTLVLSDPPRAGETAS